MHHAICPLRFCLCNVSHNVPKDIIIKEEEVDGLIVEAIRKLFKIEETNINLKKLKGKEKGSFRIRKGDIRIVFSLKKEKILHAMIKTIDFRGNVYK